MTGYRFPSGVLSRRASGNSFARVRVGSGSAVRERTARVAVLH